MKKKLEKKKVIVIVCVMTAATSALAFGGSPNLIASFFEAVGAGINRAEIAAQNDTPANPGIKTANNDFNRLNPAPPSASAIPTHVLYDSLFRLVISFERKAAMQRVFGEEVTSLTDYFKTEAGLTAAENEKLNQLAFEFLQELEPIHNQAVGIIADYRGQFPDGEIGEGQEVPAPPAELGDLQEQRNNLALSFREKLRDLLGEHKFEEFDEFIHQSFALNFQAAGEIPKQ